MKAAIARRFDPKGVFGKIPNRTMGLARLAGALPGFYRDRVTVERAESDIKRALAGREAIFLDFLRARVYARAASPYLKLLKHAGCEFSDLAAEVGRHGLEGALARLAAAGVYLTAAEMKGKTDVVRGGLSFRVFPEDLIDPSREPGFITRTGGTNNRPILLTRPLSTIAKNARAWGVFLSAHGLVSAAHAVHHPILPGHGVSTILNLAKLGIRTERWFARTVPAHDALHLAHSYLATYLTVALGRLFGPGFPRPEFADGDDTARILAWIAEKRRVGTPMAVTTGVSAAFAIARAAAAAGTSLEGATFIVGGEPFTEAKAKMVARAGARVATRYAFSGGGNIGFACAEPQHPDEIHVNQHTTAIVERPTPIPGAPGIRPFLFTTLDPSWPLLNVENGDYGILETRDCGCALGRAGLRLHLHRIRSYEKFTSEGMNYFYGDLYEFFESTLPAEFGGASGDYQLLEEEDDNGQTRLTLRADPRIGALDEARLLERLREELGRRSWGHEFQTRIWERAGTLRIKREPPRASAMGKILPLQMQTAKTSP
ncbi:MAG TPA: hypothetical protein VGH16_05890 [Candidatus Binatia bacterium]|jgi:hypothetical protein